MGWVLWDQQQPTTQPPQPAAVSAPLAAVPKAPCPCQSAKPVSYAAAEGKGRGVLMVLVGAFYLLAGILVLKKLLQ
jgi:hypothetical protein